MSMKYGPKQCNRATLTFKREDTRELCMTVID